MAEVEGRDDEEIEEIGNTLFEFAKFGLGLVLGALIGIGAEHAWNLL